MGFWSGITQTVGSLAKNAVKIGAGYAIGETIGDMVDDSDDPAKSGAAGILGIAGIYAVSAIGSKLTDSATEYGSGNWSSITKVVTMLAGGSFVVWQAGKWWNEYQEAHDNVYNPGKNEYLQLGKSSSEPVTVTHTDRTGDELMENIQTESQTNEYEMTGP